MRNYHWKRIAMLILAALLIGTEMPTTGVIAAPLSADGFEYTDNGDGTATITDYTGSETEIDIPVKLNGLDVKQIGPGAFREKNVAKVEIPYGVTFIGTNAFAYNELDEIEIPESVTVIDAYAFRSNGLTKVELSSRLEIIYSGAFYENNLTEIDIPGRVELIASNAFARNKLTEVHIPKSVTSMQLAFAYNPLVQITVDEENAVYKDIDRKGLYTKDGKTLVQGTISGDIHSDTEEIGDSAFRGIGLTEADIPNGVKRIGSQAFQDNAMEQLSLPDSLKTLYMFAFAGNKLNKIVVPENVGEIARAAFSENELTEAVILGDPEFGEDVFNDNPEEFVLRGYTGTSVKAYAEANHHPFEPLNTYAGGSGTEEDPFIILTAEQLDDVRHGLQAHYKLGADIDLSDYQSGEGWAPIAEGYDPPGRSIYFNGSFDGNGHTITGLTINRAGNYQGLFAAVGETGMIRNVRLDHVAISGGNYVGGLAGVNYGIVENSSVNDGTVDGENRVGGLVGNNYGAAIISSFAAVNVSGTDYVGGLIGENSGSNGITKTIGYAYASGEVTGNVQVGGLIGHNETANAGSINEIIYSYATGKVTGKRQAGGLVGRNFSLPGGTIRVENSYATGEVYGEEQYAGGLIGYNRTNAGSTIEVIHSYAAGEVTGAADVGGLAGQNAASAGAAIDIISSFWNKSAYAGAPPDNEIGTPVTETELMTRDTFADWDFTNAWYQYNEQTMPFLQWQNPILSWDADIVKDMLDLDESTEITVNVTHEHHETYAAADIAAYLVNPGIASVNQGTVAALRGGKAVVTVSLFGESRTIDLTVDGGKPTAPTIALDQGGWTNAAEVNVIIEQESEDVRLNEVQTIRVKVGDTAWQDYAYSDLPIALKVTAEGTTLIQAQAIDELGDTSDIAERTVKIDRSGLTVESRLTYADDDQEEYVSGTWTNRSVTADVYAGHTRGLTVTSVVYSLDEGATWVPYTEPLTISEEGDHPLWVKAQDEADNEIGEKLHVRIDRTAPSIQFAPDGSVSASPNVSSQVTVTDDGSGVDGASLYYVWSAGLGPLDAQADWQELVNGNLVNHRGADGDWYLHIRAADQAGNEGYAVSERFRKRADDQGGGDSGGETDGDANDNSDEPVLPEEPLSPELPEDVTSFTDIAGHWAERSILEAVLKGLVEGYPDGTFRPDHPVTRAEFVVMLVGAAGLEGEGAASAFTDSERIGGWAKRAVDLAVQAGIVAGYEDGSFRPDSPITRAEMAVAIAHALKSQVDIHGVATGFADDTDIPGWAKGAVEAIRKLGIVSGRGHNHFVPNDTATRAEATVMLLKMLEQR